ncbi:DUF3618 domain-containing protein [Cryptosporangium aurantiacum]|uniref:DUF3618 domain-containing protein n=1 Tax=Cryptosporangium aurantiacum TaxID=134849 RepID=A0A1M7JFD9_9ACTN|nr:DUF3618 domain-containing protein [Cryptosporangium aurantiacum]SHM51247.1 Protein of unknown function [Cryptosporangium aurantiacum]
MGPRPEELEREIAFARDQLRRDVDELVARVSPRAVAQRQADRVASEAQRISAQAVATVVPLLRNGRDQVLSRPALLGIGAGLTVLSLATVLWRVRARH